MLMMVCLKLIFDDVGKHVLDVKSGCLDLLRYEARCCHSWRGVYLKHIYFAFRRDDVVDAYDAVAMKNVVNHACYLAHAISNTGTINFLDGRSYFTLEGLGTQYLSADFDVGILPLPKYDAAQDNYRHVNWGNNLIVPASIRDPGMVGAVLELMAFFSEKIVQEAYYDTVLQYKVSNAVQPVTSRVVS